MRAGMTKAMMSMPIHMPKYTMRLPRRAMQSVGLLAMPSEQKAVMSRPMNMRT